MMYYVSSELSHHGVKGMKWGVRKQRPTIRQRIGKSFQAEGYRKASKYVQKRDSRNLRKTVSGKEFRSKNRAVIAQAKRDRGEQLVKNNQTYGKVIAKSIGKSAAVSLGSAALAVSARTVGLTSVGLMAAGAGTAYNIHNTKQTAQRLSEIRAYKKR